MRNFARIRWRTWWPAAASLAALVLAPLFTVEVPPILDYPNHLARQWLLAFGGADPVLSRIYAPHWAIIPNIAVDALMVLLLQVVPLYAAGKIVLALCLIVQLAGIAMYSRAISGRRSYWPLAGGVFLYSALFLMGFISFLLSLGLALMAAALWISWRETHPVRATLMGALAAVVIFFCHLLGVAFLGLLVVSFEIDRLLGQRARCAPLLDTVGGGALALGAVFLPSIILYALSVSGGGAPEILFLSPRIKVATLFTAVSAYDRWLDIVVACVIVTLIVAGWKRGLLQVYRATAIQLGILAATYAICPFRIGDGTWLHIRIAYMAGLILCAGVVPLSVPRRTGRLAAATLAALLFFRIGVVSAVWHDYGRDLAAFRTVIAAVAPGSKVLAVSVTQSGNPQYWTRAPRSRMIAGLAPADAHLPALLVVERRAFWPLLFNVPAQHPIRVMEPYRRLTIPAGELPDYRALATPSALDLARDPYLAGWQAAFDYVLVMNAGGLDRPRAFLPERLALVREADIAALFRVKPGAGPSRVSARGP